jgi:hypothetical protein
MNKKEKIISEISNKKKSKKVGPPPPGSRINGKLTGYLVGIKQKIILF